MRCIRPVLIGLFAFAQHMALAQPTFSIYNGSTESCQGVMHDTGGPAAFGYQNNEDITFTLCPDQPGAGMQFNFVVFDLDQSGAAGTVDNMSVYDGDGTDAPLLGTYTGTQLQGLVISTTVFNPSGCLTLHFVSNDVGTGAFAISYQCIIPCDPPMAAATMSLPSPARICAGEEVQFDASASEAAPGQSITNYEWHFGQLDVVTTTESTVTHVFTEPGSFPVTLIVSDANDCASTNAVDLLVQVSSSPVLNLTTSDTVACVGSPLELSAEVEAVPWSGTLVDYGPGIFIPDYVGTPFTSAIEFTGFVPGATLESVDAIESICVDMEHSFMGDLVLELICPDGSQVALHQQGGAGTFVGGPNDMDSNSAPIPGECWHYCWAMDAPNGTWADCSANGATPNVIQGGTAPNNALAPGTYTPVQPWDALVGCPLNGTWTFRATDLWAVDNGYLCSWELRFDEALVGDGSAFLPTYGPGCDSTYWSGPDITGSVPDCNSVVIIPSAPGEQPYTFTAINDFGCTYDSTIVINVLPATNPYCISLGLDAPTIDAINVRPMPVHDILQVSNREPITGYELLDLRGRKLLAGRATSAHGTLQVDVSALPAGFYLLRVEGASGTVPVRVVKE